MTLGVLMQSEAARLFTERVDSVVYARHVADSELIGGGVNLWGETPLCVNPANGLIY